MNKKMVLASFAAAALLATPAWANQGGERGDPGKNGGPGHARLAKIDTNKDGQVSKDEFMKAQEERFAKLDKDGNGQISQEEFKAQREEMRAKMKERRKEWREKHGAEGSDAGPKGAPDAPPPTEE